MLKSLDGGFGTLHNAVIRKCGKDKKKLCCFETGPEYKYVCGQPCDLLLSFYIYYICCFPPVKKMITALLQM